MIRGCAIALAFLTLCQRNAHGDATQKVSGFIEGHPISEAALQVPLDSAVMSFVSSHHRLPASTGDDQEVNTILQTLQCGKLQLAVTGAARSEQVRRLGVTVTQADLDEVRNSSQPIDPVAEAARIRKEAAAIIAALSAVDQGQDPPKVPGMTADAWTIYLWRSYRPEFRAELARRAIMTPEAVAKGIASMEIHGVAERRKLDQSVDEQIASGDPTFRAYLAERKRAGENPDPRKRWTNAEHMQYLDQMRAQWWRSQVSKLHVVLTDPSLFKTCGLQGLGVQAPPQP